MQFSNDDIAVKTTMFSLLQEKLAKMQVRANQLSTDQQVIQNQLASLNQDITATQTQMDQLRADIKGML